MLWYWKVDTIVKLLDDQKHVMMQQKDFLEKLYLLQNGQKPHSSSDSESELQRKARLFDEGERKSNS